jgi:MinD-like ATPase involved in chromosome partitioning or flagellar assembly
MSLPINEPPKEDRRAVARPPWLSAENPYRGVGLRPVERPDGVNDHNRAAPPAETDDPSERSGRHRPKHERVETAPNVESMNPASDFSTSHSSADDGPTGEGGGESVEAPARLAEQRLRPDARRIPLPPWKIPMSMMPAESSHDAHVSDVESPAAASQRDATREMPPHPPGNGVPPAGAPIPVPPPPPGWPPGAVAPPPWWPLPGPPAWPAPPGVPPAPAWQDPWAGGSRARSTPSHAPVPVPDGNGVPAFRLPPSLDEAKVVDRRTYAPQSGWRRAVHRATRGYVNPGDARKDREKEQLLSEIRQPIAGDFRVAVLSIKGGVGKTTTTLGLGSALAMERRDRVIAVDANPDRGTLAERVRDVSTRSTVRDLLADPNINRYADVRGHTRMAVSRLEVLASEQDPAAADVFDEADYRRTIDILGHYYNVILTDCGTGIMHSAMAGVLDLAHSIVLVSSPAIDAVRSASATLDWLMQHGYSSLVREGHVVLSASRPGSAPLKLDKVYEFFEARCRSIHFVPFDPHLAEGADVDFSMLKPGTRRAYIELAGAVAEDFPRLQAGSGS